MPEYELPEGLARAVATHLTSHSGNEIICLGFDAVGEVLAEVAAPAIRSQERQRVRETLLSEPALEAVARIQHGGAATGSGPGEHSFDYVDGEDREWALADAARTIEAALDSLEDGDA